MSVVCHVPWYEPNRALWEFIDREVNQSNPTMSKYCWINKCNSGKMVAIPPHSSSCLVRGMNRWVKGLWHKHEGYTRYWVNVCDKTSSYIHTKVVKTICLVLFLKLLKNNNQIKRFWSFIMSLLSPFFTCNNKRLDFIISFKYEIKACDLIHNKILQKKHFWFNFFHT
jgi:hypothetical protein